MNPAEATALVIDNGLFAELSIRLARDFKKVYYHCPNHSAYPRWNSTLIGTGIPEIEVVTDLWGNAMDEANIVIFPDVGMGALQVHCEEMGKLVWGSRLGEDLELDRVATKDILKVAGLPVGKYEVVHGFAALRAYLKEHKDVYVKVSKWRGTFESFYSPDYKAIEPKLDQVEYELGPSKALMTFIVEDALPDRVELALDAYVIDGVTPTQLLAGLELKDSAYIGRFKSYTDFPEPLRRVQEGLAPTFKEYGYRGFFSGEGLVGKDQDMYLTDACCRMPSPPGNVMLEFYTNIADIIWEGAQGLCVDPVPAGKFAAELVIKSTWAERNWQPIDFPDKLRRQVKLHNPIRIGKQFYAVPMLYELDAIANAIGWGDTMQDAIDAAKEVAEQVTGYFIKCDCGALDKAEEELQKAKNMGLDML